MGFSGGWRDGQGGSVSLLLFGVLISLVGYGFASVEYRIFFLLLLFFLGVSDWRWQ